MESWRTERRGETTGGERERAETRDDRRDVENGETTGVDGSQAESPKESGYRRDERVGIDGSLFPNFGNPTKFFLLDHPLPY